MASPSLQNFTTLVQSMGVVVQASYKGFTSWASGSPLRAIIEGCASCALWLQYLVLTALTATRLTTSSGSDVDSFLAQFNQARIGGTAAAVSLTFTSLNPTATSGVIPVGALATSSDGTIQFAVIADTTNGAWDAAQSAYVRPVGTASVTVPAECTEVGTVGNVAAGIMNLLGSQLVGIDTVTNSVAAGGGTDGETDPEAKARFALWVKGLARATRASIESAIGNTGLNVSYSITEGVDASGAARDGYFLIRVNAGSTVVPPATIAAIYAAVDAVRAFGISFAVIAASVTVANVVMEVTFAAATTSAAKASIISAIEAAVVADIDATAVDAGYAVSRLFYLAIANGDAQVVAVPLATINGAAVDIPAGTTARAGTVSVTGG